MAECDDRDKRRAARRIHDAGFPRDKRIEEFDFDANSSVNPAVIDQLATCGVKAGHPRYLANAPRHRPSRGHPGESRNPNPAGAAGAPAAPDPQSS
jgi:IstB-like ATP binding protein